MTINQLILSFKLKLDKTDSQAYPDILPQEIRFWLDEAADRFVKQRYERNNVKLKGFEETQKRIDDLRGAVKTETVPSISSITYGDNVFEVEFPQDYRYLLKVQCEVVRDCAGVETTTWTFPFQVQHDDINVLLEDPFNRPKPNRPLYTIEGNNLVFYTDGAFDVSNARITYIKLFEKLQPGLPNTSIPYQTGTTEYTELSEDTHNEIVDIAVKLALENIESQRYQTNLHEIRTQE